MSLRRAARRAAEDEEGGSDVEEDIVGEKRTGLDLNRWVSQA